MHNLRTAIIKCYRFHLGQAWWRKIQILGFRLSQAYEDNIGIRTFLKRPFGSWRLLWWRSYFGCIEWRERRTTSLVNNYITSRFPTVFGWKNILIRNVLKYHAHFNDQFYSPHPTIFVFMDTIQSASYIKLRSTNQTAVTCN